MRWRSLGLWIALGTVLYLGVAAYRVEPGRPLSLVALGLGPLAVLLGFALTAPPRTGLDGVRFEARGAARVTVLGAAVVLVASLAPETEAFVAARILGTGAACTAGLVAIVRTSSLGGMAAVPLRLHHLDAAVLAGLAWLVAAGLHVARALGLQLYGSAYADLAHVAAALASMGLGVVAAMRLYTLRRFELGIADRASSALWVCGLAATVAFTAGVARVAEPERLAPAVALAGALGLVGCAVARDVERVARALRLGAVVVMAAAPLVAAAVIAAYEWPTRAGLVSFGAAVIGALAGLFAPRLARALEPARGRWLRTLAEALRAAKEPEPTRAVPAVLCAIRDGLAGGARRVRSATPGDADGMTSGATLYRLASADRIVVDRADYPHVAAATVPERLVEVGSLEPYKLVTEGALRRAEVRRPELRALREWLRARHAAVAVLVMDDGMCVGVLLWPRAGRSAPLAVEEAVGFRRLADHLGAATSAAAQLARSRARELEAEHATELATARVETLASSLAREGERREELARQAALPVRVACYSAAAQTAVAAVERLGVDGRPFALVAQAGVDARPWAAAAHVASQRRQGPLHVVDGSHPDLHPLERWKDGERAPLCVARDGTLVLESPQELPLDTQRYLGVLLGERLEASPVTERRESVGIVVTVPTTVDALAAAGRLDLHLADALGDRAVVLPALALRAEDLRALALYMLTRIGLRLRGAPLGLNLRAQALLNEHLWPGNDAELESVLTLAALEAEGEVVGPEVLERAFALRAGRGRLAPPALPFRREKRSSAKTPRG
ncbi:MAG: hypothetical protein IT373_03875 [Polyangiaceae bacterium]|nr:hypothetical protein [Polyangiaceae bacterium]